MTLTQITTLLSPLQNAIALQSYEDAQDIASEISRLCRLKHLEEGQRSEARGQRAEGVKTTSQEQIQPCLNQSAAIKTSQPDITMDTRFDEQGHSESWRNNLAVELNKALQAAQWLDIEQRYDSRSMAIKAIVARVAEFENINIKTL